MTEHEFSGKAMGTEYDISIVCDSAELAVVLSEKARSTINEYENRFSRFIKESELSRLNLMKNMKVSPEFMEVTQKAFALFRATQGHFNPLLQIERLGYDKNFSEMSSAHAKKAKAFVEPYDIDFDKTILDPDSLQIVLAPGQKLDFGGFLKGYLAEKICREIMSASPSIHGAIINIGGDIYTLGLDEHDEMFEFEIENPITHQEIAITLVNQALATSGTYKRKWKDSDSTERHHILGKTGLENPDSKIISASVIHADGAAAEAYAKVFLALGDKASETLNEQKILYFLVTESGDVISNTQ